jgi:hypothetical protein
LLFPLEDSIKEYYHHTEEETKDYEPCATVFNPRITKHCDIRGEGVENGVACDLAEGILSGVCRDENGRKQYLFGNQFFSRFSLIANK